MTIRESLKKIDIILFLSLCYLFVMLIAIFHNIWDIPFFAFVTEEGFVYENVTIAGFFLWFFYAFSPTISAIIITAIVNGKDVLKKLLKGYLIWRVNWKWYIAAFLLLLAPLLGGIIFYFIGTPPGFNQNLTAGSITYLVFFGLASGPLSEELGWRGFLLPKFQKHFNATLSSIFLGLFWFAWHIPLYFIPGTSQNLSSNIIGISIYFVLVMSISIILTWLYNNSNGSLIITILGHFCFNFGSALVITILGLVNYTTYSIIGGVLGVVYLVFIFVYAGYRNFSRKPIEELPFDSSLRIKLQTENKNEIILENDDQIINKN
ncbi:MAG: CPBP family intramembrane glutamic endopeptidase [Candidatus Thorarchaeota archaeon]